jgi:hypothetical protein
MKEESLVVHWVSPSPFFVDTITGERIVMDAVVSFLSSLAWITLWNKLKFSASVMAIAVAACVSSAFLSTGSAIGGSAALSQLLALAIKVDDFKLMMESLSFHCWLFQDPIE